jgi:hypothetical protein
LLKQLELLELLEQEQEQEQATSAIYLDSEKTLDCKSTMEFIALVLTSLDERPSQHK